MFLYEGELNMSADDAGQEYFRPKTNEEALQIAIGRWIGFQYRVWKQEGERSAERLSVSATLLRIAIIVLAGLITIVADLEGVDRSIVTVVSGGLTILTGIEGYLKLTDRKITADNRRAAVLAEYDRQGYEWMTKVELETDADKALEQAKLLLATCPNMINDIVNRDLARQLGDEPRKT
jgi:hypothetical protein